MRRTILSALLLALIATSARAQDGVAQVLRQIEENNPALHAAAYDASSQKLENASTNNLENPSLSYSHLWDSDDKNITVGELVISQGFDFPSLYATRGKVNRHRASALDAQADATRQ